MTLSDKKQNGKNVLKRGEFPFYFYDEKDVKESVKELKWNVIQIEGDMVDENWKWNLLKSRIDEIFGERLI
jgi:hypothetical protein